MKYSVKISEKVIFTISDSMLFLANVNKGAAKREKAEILKLIHSLEEFPLRNPIVDNLEILGKEVRKFPILNGKYVILYTIIEKTVYINKFLDSRRENKIIADLK